VQKTTNPGPLAGGGGWRRLWWHSLRVGLRNARLGALQRPEIRRGVLNRILVPMDPWRYYELGRIAEQDFSGRCLDVSSPKLLASLLQHEGRGEWTAIDLLSSEVELWRALDPALDVRVEDARRLSFPDESFDCCICLSVVEHIRGDGHVETVQELWRVLRPGGVLHLTTNVAPVGTDVFVDQETWGESERVDGRVFFEHRFDEEEIRERLLGLPWEILHRETVTERRQLSDGFARLAPASYLVGTLLRLIVPRNLALVASASDVRGPFGVAYLRLRKPDGGVTDLAGRASAENARSI